MYSSTREKCYFCPILTKVGTFRQISETNSVPEILLKKSVLLK